MRGRRWGMMLAAVIGALAIASPAYATVGQPRTGSPKYDRSPSVVEYGGTTYLFFARSQEDCTRLAPMASPLCPDQLDYDLYYKTSSDGGKTFGPATLLDANPDGILVYRGRTVAATATADGVHVLWSDGASGIDGRVFHYFAPGGGTAFTGTGGSDEVTEIPDDVFNAEAVGDGSNLFVYAQEMGDINAYRFTASGSDLTLTGGPTLAADSKSLPRAIKDVNGGFRMTMTDDSGYPTVDVYTDSSADGLNWPAPEELVVSQPGVSNWDPSLIQKPNGQYYLYHAPDPDMGTGTQRIALTMSNDFVDWTTPHEISPGKKDTTEYWDYWPEGFVRGNQIVLFYTSERAVNQDGVSYPSRTGHIWTDPGFGGLDHLGAGA